MNAILTAIVDDDYRAVEKLLEADRDLARRPIRTPKLYRSKIFHWLYAGDTALHLAAAGYRVEIAQHLLNAGADPNAAQSSRRGAPLHYAADGYMNSAAWNPDRQVKMIQLLLAAGASINAQDKNGATPLHRAV